ncbi:hypothetical protein PROFUN_13751 [Planoprotostelium fungivorum]|uniref:Anamorsin homolog n=1 Tax=Planoprotostelium fungivorum TaxID=1890364 RepID=A0A2P6N316_9EUKA|nr:hypothetical protein PROFUN_13751 [Planoprotostelium fungivorum]
MTVADNSTINSSQINEVAQTLAPGKSITVIEKVWYEPVASQGVQQDTITERDIILALTRAGLVDVKRVSSKNVDSNHEEVEIVATKPTWQAGASSSLKLNRPAGNEKKVWSLPADDEELADEDELLDEDDLKKPAKPDDCEFDQDGKRSACKNCTCGRKEQSEEVVKPAKSSCGNRVTMRQCYLGDAFRCGGCPYLGKPAFKSGDKVELSLDADDI